MAPHPCQSRTGKSLVSPRGVRGPSACLRRRHTPECMLQPAGPDERIPGNFKRNNSLRTDLDSGMVGGSSGDDDRRASIARGKYIARMFEDIEALLRERGADTSRWSTYFWALPGDQAVDLMITPCILDVAEEIDAYDFNGVLRKLPDFISEAAEDVTLSNADKEVIVIKLMGFLDEFFD